MNRRNFLSLTGAAVGGILLEQAIPFGRVYSFPTNISVVKSFLPDALVAAIRNGDFAEYLKLRDEQDNAFYEGTNFERLYGSSLYVPVQRKQTVILA